MFVTIIIVCMIIHIVYKNRNNPSENTEKLNVKDINPRMEYNCKCPYCNRMYNLEDGYYLCECDNYFRKEGNKLHKAEETVNEVIENLVIVMAYISKADGIVTNEEIKVVKEILNLAELNKKQIKWCAELFNKYKNLEYSKNAIYLLDKYINSRKELKLFCLNSALHISQVDGDITYNQSLIISDMVSILNIPLIEYERLKQNYDKVERENDLSDYYKILNIDPSASYEEIKHAYRKLAKIYHPDIQNSKDLPEEIVKDIKGKYQKIQEAYEIITKNVKLKEHDSLSAYYKILDIKIGASKEEIKQAYQKLIESHHIYLEISKNISEEELKNIIQKINEIEEAYAILIKNAS